MKKKGKKKGGKVKKRNRVIQFYLQNLPTTVIQEILFKLPVKSIMNLKLVCRAMRKLISHPDFSRNYAKNSPYTTFLFPPLIGYSDMHLLEISDKSECIRTKFKPNLPYKHSYVCIVGISNALICISQPEKSRIYICNLVMGKCIELPRYRIKPGVNTLEVFEFSFCRFSNNYKVLRISCLAVDRGIHLKGRGQILTIGVDDKWRDLVDTVIPLPQSMTKPFAFNGIFHWFLLDKNCTRISTFDLGEEKPGRLSHPSGMVLNHMAMSLISLDNQLCLVDRCDHSLIVMWKMREYGVGESWYKDFVLEFSVSPEVRLKKFFLVAVLENGNLLFTEDLIEQCSILYNPTKRELIKIQFHGFDSVACAPSFSSLTEIITGWNQSTTNVLSM